MIGEQTMPE